MLIVVAHVHLLLFVRLTLFGTEVGPLSQDTADGLTPLIAALTLYTHGGCFTGTRATGNLSVGSGGTIPST